MPDVAEVEMETEDQGEVMVYVKGKLKTHKKPKVEKVVEPVVKPTPPPKPKPTGFSWSHRDSMEAAYKLYHHFNSGVLPAKMTEGWEAIFARHLEVKKAFHDVLDPETGRRVIEADKAGTLSKERLLQISQLHLGTNQIVLGLHHPDRHQNYYGTHWPLAKAGIMHLFQLFVDDILRDGLISKEHPIFTDGRVPVALLGCAKPGMKVTKALVRMHQLLTGHKPEASEGFVSRFADTVAGATAPQKIVISANILDYAMASWNCPFSSCHQPDGQYRAGPIQYMQEPLTLIVYSYAVESTPLKPIAGEHKLPLKTWRCMVHILPGRKGKTKKRDRDGNYDTIEGEFPPTVNIGQFYGDHQGAVTQSTVRKMIEGFLDELGWDRTGMKWVSPVNCKGVNQCTHIDEPTCTYSTQSGMPGLYKCEPVICPKCGKSGDMRPDGGLVCGTCLPEMNLRPRAAIRPDDL